MTNAANIPDSLKNISNWVCWRREERGGKQTKVPYRASLTEKRAAVDNPETWSSFAKACSHVDDYDGIGFVLNLKLRIVGIDLDHCIQPDGTIDAWALAIIDRMQTYTEISPSGTGIRMLCYGALPPGRRRKGHFEIYDNLRYLTVTGNLLPDYPSEIAERQDELQAIHAEMLPPEPSRKPVTNHASANLDMSDTELLEKAFAASNGSDIEALWNGNMSDYNDDHSAADLALCNFLAFYCGSNGDGRLDHLFRQSALMRPKWDEKRRADGATYGHMTIEKAYAGMSEFYEGASDWADLQLNRNVGKSPYVGEVLDGVSNIPRQGKNQKRTPSQSQKQERPPAIRDEINKCWNVGGFFEFDDLPIGLEVGEHVPFPRSALPDRLLAYVEEVAKVVQVPIEMPAMLSLATVAAAVSRRWEVRIGRTHEEPCCLYIAVAAEPGARKSQALNAVQFPLQEFEAELLHAHEDIKAEAEQAVTEATSKAMDLQKDIAKERDDEKRKALTEELKAVKRQLAQAVPAQPRLLVDDVTQERLAQLLIESDGCLAMLSDEGGIFDILAGRYSEGLNLDLFLKAHDAGRFRVDRLNRPSEHVKRACMTIGLCVQPDIIQRALGNKKEFKGRGLLGRFLFAIPPDIRGQRPYDPQSPGIDAVVKHEYGQMVKLLLRYPAADPSDTALMHTLQMDSDALDTHARLMNDIEARQGEDRDLRPFADWANKLAGRVARIAGILHCIEFCEDRPETTFIDTQTVLMAWKIGTWLIAHMKRSYGLAQDSEVSLMASKIMNWLRDHGMYTFQERDITAQFHKDCNKEFRQKAIDDLKDLGWVKGPEKFLNPKTNREIEIYGCCVHPKKMPETK